MCRPGAVCDREAVRTRPPLRRSYAGVVAGVCGGLAEHLGGPAWGFRLAFVALVSYRGLGVFLYLALWGAVPLSERPPGSLSRRETFAFVTAGTLLAAVVMVALAFSGDRRLWAGLVSVVGLVLVWRQADVRRTRGVGVLLLLAGVTALLGGLAWFAMTERHVGYTLVALLVAAAAGWPWWRRLAADLGTERRARIRSQERAEVAAHLHDSVLQTLTLIQRQATSPRDVQRLARRQERELRDWLRSRTGPVAEHSLGAAIRAAADEVEDGYGVLVELVAVGDAPMGERAAALVQAAREAMVNAARHSGAATVSVYAEVEPDRATVFVRDRGRGFDPSVPANGRYGLAESVVGRMRRHGGWATVQSVPGEGTEVELELPW